ncbi:MAG: PhoH family protein [Bacteroidetes bacterium]|nr:PhoH family protein [Bacteroidota bacterium]
MVEKVITLENVSLIDFLGIENANIQELATAFPKSKIISRGNEIKIKGSTPEILKINEILVSLLQHYHKYGKITHQNVQNYIQKEEEVLFEPSFDDILLYGNKGIKIKPKTTNQKKMVSAAMNNDMLFVIGPAGTGKTYISVALAIRALKNKEVKKIIITKPAVEAGESLGFLPGDMQEKIDPYLRPIYDALDDMLPPEKLRYYQENRIIEIAPLAYMRGRTLHHAFILLDEAQNTTAMQIKMFLTRMGPNSKMIVTGDISQVDLPDHQKSGLMHSLDILKNIKEIGYLELGPQDVVRHKIVKKIIEAYDKAKESKA